ncbi:DoxX family protein [Streptomyces sp. NBC_00829]|uniref:DoxX family protein n=1 Tax=Streptomyces sp. NBC_00829 TaxID=2903679 RepID=UPI00386A9DCB|nr:DoxX family protein [Streptomyces sp. NBC_00829]
MKVRAGTLLRILAPSQPNRATRRNRLRTGNALNSPHWSEITRVAFRFGFTYSGLYCLTTPQIFLALRGGGLGHLQAAADSWAKLWSIRPVRNWVAVHVFDKEVGERFDGGDDLFTWVGQFCWLMGAAAVTPIWSVLDRRRTNYVTLDTWFRLAVRMCLAGQMFSYGAAKAIPLQFQLPLAKLIEPFGNFSPMGVLWSQTGSSKTYQILLGCAEIAGGLLLILPRTATLGALLCAVELTQVFILNMTFDVPVKIHSFHLLLLSLVLLAPESARLAEVFLSNRTVHRSPRPELFRTRRANRIAAAGQVAVGLWLLGSQIRNDWAFWKEYGGGREKPALYGIWNVDEFSIDGVRNPPLTTDKQRWRRVVIDSADIVTIQRMDDSLDGHIAAIDMNGHSITLLKMADPTWKATLTLQRPADDLLTLDGEVDGNLLHLRLHRLDLDTFPLVRRGFHWVQENAYMR